MDFKDRQKKLIKEQNQKTEELIKKHLPDNFNINDIEWRYSSIVRGASTLFYQDEPVLTLFAQEFKIEESDEGKTTITVEQKYLNHIDNENS